MTLCQLVHNCTAVGTSILTYKLHFTEVFEFSIFGRIQVHVCSFLSPQKNMKVSCSSSEIENFALEWKKKKT